MRVQGPDDGEHRRETHARGDQHDGFLIAVRAVEVEVPSGMRDLQCIPDLLVGVQDAAYVPWVRGCGGVVEVQAQFPFHADAVVVWVVGVAERVLPGLEVL